MLPGVNCVFLHVALQTIWNRKENIGEKRHNSTVGGKVSVERKKNRSKHSKSLAKVINTPQRVILFLEITVISEENN
jgi:hypothetical protein